MDTFVSQPTAHIHAPNPERIPVIELNNEIKLRAAYSDESTSVILHSALRSLPLRSAGELPRTDALMRTIRRQRTVPSVASDGRLADHLKKLIVERISFCTKTRN
jgi:hypothetical protein